MLQLEFEIYIFRFGLILDFTDIYHKTDLSYIKIKINNIVLKCQHSAAINWIRKANPLKKLFGEPSRKIVIAFIPNSVAYKTSVI